MLTAVYTVCGLVTTTLVALATVNKYFNFRIYRGFPFTSVVLVVNMVLLLVTAALLPLDLYDTETNLAKDKWFHVIWLTVYWLQFLICWLVIPILISYVSLRYAIRPTEVAKKLTKSVYLNVKFYLICLVALVIGLFYLMMSTGHGLREVKSLLISLSHLYSLTYTLILLSTGLILLPRDLLTSSLDLHKNRNLNALFVKLSKINEDMNDSQLNLNDSASLILNTKEQENGDIVFNDLLRDCKLEIESKLEELKASSLLTTPLIHINESSNLATSSITNPDKLNKHYNDFINNYYNFLYDKVKSEQIIHQLAELQDETLTDNKKKMLKRFLQLICGLLALTLSTLVYFMELTPNKWLHGWLFLEQNWYNFILELSIISYNTFCSLYAMSKFKFLDFHLISNGQSNPSNALYYSLYSSRLLFPLCFNLIALIPSHKSDDGNGNKIYSSTFERVLYKDLSVIPIVNFLNRYLPIIFMTVIPISYKFDIKQKILLKILGEEYYYQFFGMMLYEPVGEIPTTQQDVESRARISTTNNGASTIISQQSSNPISLSRPSTSILDEDYEYSLQDGKYLFERAANSLRQNSPQNNNPLMNLNTSSNDLGSDRLTGSPAPTSYL
ncbi:hypothetical protein RNJ44_03098 [Nakaseomyces bracarensis]|uniref:Uncharacterized protein n=1 Tax=Nakaseomyces bracarensis TaxID=273131 RepID=A0ABR4NYT0_9SACH